MELIVTSFADGRGQCRREGAEQSATHCAKVISAKGSALLRFSLIYLAGAGLLAAQIAPPVIQRAFHAVTFDQEICPGCPVAITGRVLPQRLFVPILPPRLPLEFDGVKVSVHGVPAPLAGVQSGRVDFIAPETGTYGEVTVTLTTAGGSASVKMNMQRAAPALHRDGRISNRAELRDSNDGIKPGALACAQAGKALLPQTWPTVFKPASPRHLRGGRNKLAALITLGHPSASG